VDAYAEKFRKHTNLARDVLDAAKVIAMLEVERPSSLGWRSASDEGTFPAGIEAICTEALKAAGIKSSSAFRSALQSQAVRAAEKKFSVLSLQAPTHLATALIVIATESRIILKDYFPEMTTNPSIATLLEALNR